MNELVSVIMPSYNSSKYIKASIESVLNQTYKDLELIIVDDCSTDDTVEIIKSFSDPRIRFFQNEVNSGAAISRNKALREAKGKWIAFLDSDDVWLNEKLEQQINFMNDNNYHASYTDYRIYKDGKWEPYIRTAPNKMTYRKIINYCYVFTSTVMYDSDAVGLIQIQDLKKNNDYAMWLHLFYKTEGFRLKKCLSYYIRHNNSISNVSKIELIKHHYILFKKELKSNCLHSVLLTINNVFFGIFKKIVYKKRVNK